MAPSSFMRYCHQQLPANKQWGGGFIILRYANFYFLFEKIHFD